MYKRFDEAFKSLSSVLSFLFVVIALSEGANLFISHHAQATEAPSGLVYQGRIIKPDSNPLESNSVNFDVSIYSADGSCLLYEETHNVDMTGSAGSFALSLGSGTSTGPGYTIQQVFSNTGSFTGGGSCSYSPASGDARQIIVSFNDGSGAVALQSQVVRSVPYALYASKLEGLGRSDFLQINTATSSLSQSNANTLFQTATYNELIALAGGTSTQFAKASDLPVSSGVLNLSGAGQGVRVLDTPAAGDYAVNKNYSDAYIGGRSIDSTNLASLGNGQSIMWDTTANSGLGGWVKYTPASTSNTVINGGQAGAISLGPTDANSLTFKTNNTAQMTVDSAGKVGIGTASPQLRLSVAGNGTFTSELYNGKTYMHNGGTSNVNVNSPGSVLDAYLDTGTGDVMRWGPTYIDSGSISGTLGYNGSSNTVTINAQNAALTFGIQTENMRVDTTGNVGVGTTSPGSIMHINSKDTAGNSVLETLRLSHEDTNSAGANGIGASLTFNLETTTNGTFREAAKIEGVFDDANNNSKDGSLRFYTMGPNAASGTTTTTERMRINSSGYLGLGTASPAAPLDVAGDVKIGNSNAGCSGTNEGSLRYTAAHTLEVCDGTSWSIIQATTCSDPVPNVMSFADEANASTSTLITSDIILVSGINCVVPVTISGSGSPQYQICSDASCTSVTQGWTSSPASVSDGQYLQTRLTADAVGGSTFQATIIVGSGATVWSVTTTGSCAGSPAVGTVCADGTVYAGLSPDGNNPMYTTRCDAGQTWSGSACTGSRVWLSWNNGSGTATWTSISSYVTGQANSAALASLSDGGAPYAAAVYCETLNLNGHTDWYLPAFSELTVLYSGKAAIRNFTTSDNYWTSREEDDGNATSFNFINGSDKTDWKWYALFTRCVRR